MLSDLIPKGLRNLVLEEEPKKPGNTTTASQAAAAARPAPSAAPYRAPVASPSSYSVPTGSGETNEAYDRLLASTQFESTDVGQILQKYLEPLKNVPMDPTIRMKTAIAQATAIDKITQEQIIAAFDRMGISLTNEQSSFETWKRNKESLVTELSNRISDLQKQINDTSVELSTQQTKLSVGQSKFSVAMQRRRAEIEQQAAQYRSYLQ